MKQPKVGVVGVTCRFESGGQRAEELINGVQKRTEQPGVRSGMRR